MPLGTGTRLGPYEIISAIGAGGMGEVYRARDTRLDRTVAVKVLPARVRNDRVLRDRFEREARTIAQLNHPHICQLYDVGPDYLVMEYVEGAPLAGPLLPDQAFTYSLQICDALDAAHRKGVVHRDLKPANILVTPTGVKLLDFGLAQVAQVFPDDAVTNELGLTLSGTILGTPGYMSPEQAEAKPVDARSDIFSFGAVLYEMLSGRRAFTGDSLIAVMAAVLRLEPDPLDAPDSLRRVVARCLSKSPGRRYQSVAELRDALHASAASKARDQRPSIAVLPFANMSRDADDEYFSDGLAEEIINALVKIPGLKVIARTSAFAFKGQNTDIRRIADVLGVANILEGSVRRAGNRIRVTAQLITAADGSHLWSERYDRQMEDLFAMQDEIATAIASELKVQFAATPAARSRRQPDLQAYEAYLRYLEYQWEFTPQALQRSRECLEQAIALDPDFALPYVGLADHYLASMTFGQADELVPRARSLAERALALDPDLAEAHAMLGVLAANHKPNFQEAERRFHRAVGREPVPWHVRSWYSNFFLQVVGRYEEAVREGERALEDNPLSQILHWCLGNVLRCSGLDAQAEAAWAKAIDLDAHFWVASLSLCLHHTALGRAAEARMSAERAFSISPNPQCAGVLAGALRDAGEHDASKTLLDRISYGTQRSSLGLALFSFATGDIDRAVAMAGEALDEGYVMTATMFVRPFERQLHGSPGWPDLLRRFNLPEAPAALQS